MISARLRCPKYTIPRYLVIRTCQRSASIGLIAAFDMQSAVFLNVPINSKLHIWLR